MGKARFGFVTIASLSAVLGLARSAHAGMPSIGLSEMAQLRLEGISFFLVGMFASALVVKLLWNALVKDFPSWPRLTYPKACAAVTLWGLVFVIVLTMISGARELMTPGAWEKKGGTYALNAAAKTQVANDLAASKLDERKRSLEKLATLLQTFAVQHDGRYPSLEEAEAFPADLWRLPDASGMKYVYVPGLATADGEKALVYEPNIFPGEALVLRADGKIEFAPTETTAVVERDSSRSSTFVTKEP